MQSNERMVSGVTIYAVEGAVWAALTAAWISLRLAMAASLADQSMLVSAALLSVFHLILSSALSDSPKTEEAYFNAVLPIFIAYAALVGDAAVSPARVDRAFFGGLALFLVPAAVSLAFLTVQTLLAAAAASRDGSPWKPEAMWLDGAILLTTAVQACLFQQHQLGIASTLLGLHIGFIVSLGARLWKFSPDTMLGSISMPYFLEILHCCLIGVICALAIGGAYDSGTTVWALIVVLAPLMALSIVRVLAWPSQVAQSHSDEQHRQPPSEQHAHAEQAAASLVYAHPNYTPPPVMTFVQPSAPARLLVPPRPVVKKQL